MAFPTFDRPPSKVSYKISVPVFSERSSAGYTMQRRKDTREIRTWSIVYDSSTLLKETDANTLETYFINNSGTVFIWTHPEDLIDYTVFFKEDSLEISAPHFGMGYYSAKFTLQEA